jgi:hypothetical protein
MGLVGLVRQLHCRACLRMLPAAFCEPDSCTAAFGHVPRAAEAKNRATQAKNPHVRSAFQDVARAWLLLAEQMEWMDRREETREGNASR